VSARFPFNGSGAIFHPGSNGERTFRLLLWRVFDPSKPLLGVVMKNPSVASEDTDDPTVRVLLHIARDEGAGGIVVGNLVPYVATDQREMLRAYRSRCANAEIFRAWCRMWEEQSVQMARLRHECPRVLVAWGKLPRDLRNMAAVLLWSLSESPSCGELLTLGRNKDGTPHHPLRVRLGRLQPFYQETT
jgi:hypothetical protein